MPSWEAGGADRLAHKGFPGVRGEQEGVSDKTLWGWAFLLEQVRDFREQNLIRHILNLGALASQGHLSYMCFWDTIFVLQPPH